MAICPIIVHFSTKRARSMYDVACEFARAAVQYSPQDVVTCNAFYFLFFSFFARREDVTVSILTNIAMVTV